jgi:hypothetical protein
VTYTFVCFFFAHKYILASTNDLALFQPTAFRYVPEFFFIYVLCILVPLSLLYVMHEEPE